MDLVKLEVGDMVLILVGVNQALPGEEKALLLARPSKSSPAVCRLPVRRTFLLGERYNKSELGVCWTLLLIFLASQVGLVRWHCQLLLPCASKVPR